MAGGGVALIGITLVPLLLIEEFGGTIAIDGSTLATMQSNLEAMDIERFLNLEKEEETRAREKAKTKEETL